MPIPIGAFSKAERKALVRFPQWVLGFLAVVDVVEVGDDAEDVGILHVVRHRGLEPAPDATGASLIATRCTNLGPGRRPRPAVALSLTRSSGWSSSFAGDYLTISGGFRTPIPVESVQPDSGVFVHPGTGGLVQLA